MYSNAIYYTSIRTRDINSNDIRKRTSPRHARPTSFHKCSIIHGTVCGMWRNHDAERGTSTWHASYCALTLDGIREMGAVRVCAKGHQDIVSNALEHTITITSVINPTTSKKNPLFSCFAFSLARRHDQRL